MDDRKNMPQNNGNVIQNLILENRGNGDYIKLSVFINDLYRYYPDYTPKDFGCNSNQEFFKKLGFDVIFDEKGAMVIR